MALCSLKCIVDGIVRDSEYFLCYIVTPLLRCNRHALLTHVRLES